jgi:glycosyltransferase involved in cell wall biosynthesis
LHGLDWRREKWGKFAKWYLKQGEQAAMYFPTKTIVVSRTMREHYRQVYKKEVIYIPNGVNIPSLYRINKICKFGLKKDGYILFVGRLVPEKGCHFLIQAFKNLQTDLKLVIAGGSRHTDEYAESLKREASDKIVFTGYVYGDVLAELFSNAYFFVQPSTLEGLPISLLEAMSYGRCVIASDIPENLEVIEDSGYPFRNKDINHLQEVMVMLLENPKLVTEAGEKAIQRVAEEYNWAHIADTTERIFLSIV